MKILFVSYVSNLSSGIGNRVYYLSKELAKLGHDITILTKIEESAFNLKNLKIIYSSKIKYPILPPAPLPNVLFFQFEALNKIKKLIKKEIEFIDFQHVHISPIILSLLKIKKLTKFIVTIHGTEIGLRRIKTNYLNLLLSYFEKLILKYSPFIISVSNFIKNEIVKYYKISSNKIYVIHNGINIKEFDKNKKEELKNKLGTDKLLCFLGGFSYRKGFYFLVKALKNVKNKEWKIIIIGKCKILDFKIAKYLIEKYNLNKNIIYYNFLKRQDLIEILINTDIYVHPAIYEPFGIAILEAMASKNAIISSNIGGIPEIVNDAGILINPYNIKEITSSIEKLLSDSKLLKELKEKSFNRAKLFDWKNIAKKYENILNKIIK